jgi:ankyrin repeat protein
MSTLLDACRDSDTERVKQLLDGDGGAHVNEQDDYGRTALWWASMNGHTEVVKLLLDKGALLDDKNEDGLTALMLASANGHTEVVKLLLDRGALVDEKNKYANTALMLASDNGHTEVVKLLLDKGALVDEKDEEGDTALMLASLYGHTEVARLLLDKGALVGVKSNGGNTALSTVVAFDEDQLGRMAAAQVHRYSLQLEGKVDNLPDATAKAVLQLVRLAGFARDRACKLRSSDSRSANDHLVLFGRLQLAAAACVRNDESGEARGKAAVQELFHSGDGRMALEHAVEIEAKEMLAQPVVQEYIKLAWRGRFVNLARWEWNRLFLFFLLQLLFLLPLVSLVPALEPFLTHELDDSYLLGLPVVKFGLECAADLALALALTLIPAADLATAPAAPLLLVWVGSGLLWEGRQLMAHCSSNAKSRLARMGEKLSAYWAADCMNRVDATGLIVSLVALIAAVSEDSVFSVHEATSVRAAAVFLLWFRFIRVLLISPMLIPYVMMFFDMISSDLVRFLVLLLFVLAPFTASWTVLLEPSPALVAQQFGDEQTWRWTFSPVAHLETAGCANELGGVDIGSTFFKLLEGALTGNDFFDCARDSINSPMAAWVISFVFVMLTTVLLLNMLIAMCAAATQHSSPLPSTCPVLAPSIALRHLTP